MKTSLVIKNNLEISENTFFIRIRKIQTIKGNNIQILHLEEECMEQTPEEIREHYEVEKELANKLKQSSKEERKYLYASLYDELFQRVPHHPMLTRKTSSEETQKYVSKQMNFLKRFLRKDQIFAEIGPGDCSLSFEICKYVKKIYGIDASKEISSQTVIPDNFQKIISDGVSVPLPPNSVNIVYSDQLIEHLHPDDVIEHLVNIKNVLVRRGKYICVTPNRLFGPHDISLYFDDVASGFHLKEYTFSELKKIFKKAGFALVFGYISTKRKYFRFPFFLLTLLEKLLKFLSSWRRRRTFFKPYIQIRIIGVK